MRLGPGQLGRRRPCRSARPSRRGWRRGRGRPSATSAGCESSSGQWLRPPTDGTKIIPMGPRWARCAASCPAPDGTARQLRPTESADDPIRSCTSGSARTGSWSLSHSTTVVTPRRSASAPMASTTRRRAPDNHSPLGRADLGPHPGLVRHDVQRTQARLEPAHGRDAVHRRTPALALDGDDGGRRGRQRVPSLVRRHRPGVVRVAGEPREQPLDPRDGGDHTDRRARRLQHGALLDVQLDVAVQRSRCPRLGQGRGRVEAERRHDVAEPPPLVVRAAEVLGVQEAGDRARADARDAERVRLLTEEVHDHAVALELLAALAQPAHHLDRTDDPVEAAAAVHRVGVRTGHEGPRTGSDPAAPPRRCPRDPGAPRPPPRASARASTRARRGRRRRTPGASSPVRPTR